MMLRKAPQQILRGRGRRLLAWFNPPRSRLRLRRRLLLCSAPVLALLLAAAAAVVTVLMAGHSAVTAFNNHDIDALRDDVDRLRGFGVIDPAAIAFAEGDLFVLEGRLTDAEARFAESLQRTAADASCPVRINLELIRETLGDLAVRSGRIDDADRLYNGAAAVVADAPGGCFGDNAERRAVRADAQPRLQRKLAFIHQPPPPPPSGVATVTPAPPPPPGSPGGTPGPRAPALPPIGQGAPGQPPPTQPPPLPPLPGVNLPVPPPPPSAPAPGAGQPGQGPLPVADPAAPNAPRILGKVGSDGLPLGDPNVAGPDLSLHPGQGAPIDRLQALLENANSYGGERE